MVVVFDTASPALGTDVFAANVDMNKYTRGKSARKVMWIAILGGTVGIACKYIACFFHLLNMKNILGYASGKFSLKYGADVIAEHLQSTLATNAFTTTNDYQGILDGRWCSPETNVSLTVTEAPAATLKIIVGLLEAGGSK